MKNFDKKGGISIIGVIFFGLIIILALSYFNVNIKSIAESPTGQENINYVQGSVKDLWNTYLAKPASYLWNDVVVKIFWKSFISNMERIRDGQPTDFDKAGNNLKIQ